MNVETMLGFRIIRRGREDDSGRSYYCERVMSGRVVSVSPAQEREFVMYQLLNRVLEDNTQLKREVAEKPKAKVERDDDGDLVVVADGDGS